jgi:quercetin dioxygenase-like cupin family protein
MRRNILLLGLLVAIIQPMAVNAADEHVVAQADTMKWGPAPPALPKGAQMAVIAGDPGKEVPYVLRVKVPAGYKVPAHTHPSDENVTVISGNFHIGMGAKLDETKGDSLKAGGFTIAPKGMQHYAWFTEETVIQIHGVGPFAITYVNPADDPRKGN